MLLLKALTIFSMVSDFLRRTPPRPDEIAAQTLLKVIGKGLSCSFSVLSIVPENRKYRKSGSKSISSFEKKTLISLQYNRFCILTPKFRYKIATSHLNLGFKIQNRLKFKTQVKSMFFGMLLSKQFVKNYITLNIIITPNMRNVE